MIFIYIYACVEGELHLKTLPKISCDNYICFAIIKITGIIAFGPTLSTSLRISSVVETSSKATSYFISLVPLRIRLDFIRARVVASLPLN